MVVSSPLALSLLSITLTVRSPGQGLPLPPVNAFLEHIVLGQYFCLVLAHGFLRAGADSLRLVLF